MSETQYTNNLPINDVIPEIKNVLTEENTIIINAPAGAGKSTLLPLKLLNAEWLSGQKIIMLEPRRLAAKTIAMRMASILNEKVGETVGYRVRFDNVSSSDTKIEVVTEGILTRMIQSDNELEGIGAVIFDEFHERSIHADMALALCRESQEVLRDDLRIIIMSATLNLPELKDLLNCKTIVSRGRQYPVEIKYSGNNDEVMLPELTVDTVIKAVSENEGDTLVFLPGQREITRCMEMLKQRLKDFLIKPLYGQLPYNKQLEAILPDRQGRRKIVLSTSIAETSLTIEGISIVVDSGFGRVSCFDARSGLSRLRTVQISKDSADQRAGRAGRLGPGNCYRMWSKATDNRLDECRKPEILDTDLASLMLEMAIWGMEDVNSLKWLTTPPSGNLKQAKEILHQIGALREGRITEYGKVLHELPCHPRIAHMLITAKEEGTLSLATDLAAILEEKDPLSSEYGIDINLRIEKLRRLRETNNLSGRFFNIDKIAANYRRMLNIQPESGIVDPYQTGLLLVFAFPERIAFAVPGNNAQFKLANGNIAAAGHRDDLAHEQWLAVANINARNKVGTIFLASPLNPQDLKPFVRSNDVVRWDMKKGVLIANSELRIGSIVLQQKPIQNISEELRNGAIIEVVKKYGKNLLNFDESVIQLQNRVISLRKWNQNANWPDFTTEGLLCRSDEWLTPYLTSVRRNEDFKKIDLSDILYYSLEWSLQSELDKLAPERVVVPSGSKIKLKYSSDASLPVLAVRLQELFGLTDTPVINGGKSYVIIHLLSPGFKLVQITSDLRSFWSDAYFEVKKEMKKRYPKHSWPEDPLNEVAVRGVVRSKHKKS